MIPSSVVKEIVIEAPVDVVWRIVTEPDQIVHWFSEEAEVDLRAGAGGRLRFKSGDTHELQVEVVDPPRRFAFRWVRRPGSVLRTDNSLLVEFTLHPENGNTRLRVVESGFDEIDWSDAEKAKYAEDHGNGWEFHLGRLRDFARAKTGPR